MSTSRFVHHAAGFLRAYIRIPSAHKLAVAFVAGAAAGWLMGPSADALRPLGDLFVGLLRILVLPVVISTVLAGLSFTAVRAAGRLGSRVVVVYLVTALAASITGVATAALLDPGVGMALRDESSPLADSATERRTHWLSQVVTADLISVRGNGGLLLVTVLAIAVALSIAAMRRIISPSALAPLDHGIKTFHRIVYAALGIVMEYAPFGTFALIAVTVGGAEAPIAGHLARVFASVYVGQAAVAAGLLLLVAALSVPVRGFISAVKVPLLTAFATGSSAATLPVEIEAAGQRLRLDAGVVGFALPLGALINKTGTAVHLAVIAAFASNLSGQPLSLERTAAVCVAAFIAAVVTPPVSGGSYVVMAGMLHDLGLPLAVIGVVAGIPFLGKLNTPVNSLGRLVVTQVVARWHNLNPATAGGGRARPAVVVTCAARKRSTGERT